MKIIYKKPEDVCDQCQKEHPDLICAYRASREYCRRVWLHFPEELPIWYMSD